MVSRRDLRLFRMEQPIVLLASWRSLAIRLIFTEPISSGCLTSFGIAEIACSRGHCPGGGAANQLSWGNAAKHHLEELLHPFELAPIMQRTTSSIPVSHSCCLAHQRSSS